jgi:protein involved in polysaccharide export with SLBB domain
VRRALILVYLLALGGAGCTSGPGRGFSLCTGANRLMDAAKELRLANVHTVQIPRELEKEPLPPYTVEPGDVLLVQPIELDSPVRLPGDQPILPDGSINLGKYGQLQVAGKTVAEVETMVNALVRAQTKDTGFVSVRVVARVSKVYYVLGAVNSPGAFPLAGRETVLDGILTAGGLTDNASRDNIILARPSKPNCCRTVLPVCYRHIVQLGDTSTNYQLAPGDRIYVPCKTVCELVFGAQHSQAPCVCSSVHTPCTLPPYIAGPCPEHGQGPLLPVAALTPPTSASTPAPVKLDLAPLPLRLSGSQPSHAPCACSGDHTQCPLLPSGTGSSEEKGQGPLLSAAPLLLPDPISAPAPGKMETAPAPMFLPDVSQIGGVAK